MSSSVLIENEEEEQKQPPTRPPDQIDSSSAEDQSSSMEGTVTLTEVYEQLQNDARQAQVLAARAGPKLSQCSYSIGAHSQPIYWCRTCHPPSSNSPIGICLGCSMNCHLDHEVEELFEKRGFRCDCGNETAGGSCQLQPVKEPVNSMNVYNHNWKGEYCYCNGTYDSEKDIMYCCILCQDWFHDRCIDSQLKDKTDETSDFFCRNCLALPQYSILIPYLDHADTQAAIGGSSVPNTPAMSRSTSLVNPTAATPSSEETKIEISTQLKASTATSEESKEAPATVISSSTDGDAVMTSPSHKRKIDEISSDLVTRTAAASSVTPSTSLEVVCQRITSPSSSTPSSSTGTPVKDRFVAGNWNIYLCQCPACVTEYSTRNLTWLLDDELTADDAKNDTNILGAMTDAETSAPIDAAYDAEAITATMVERMPRATAIDIITPFQLYQASIKRQLNEFQERCPGMVVSAEVIQTITACAKRESLDGFREMKRARMNGDETIPE